MALSSDKSDYFNTTNSNFYNNNSVNNNIQSNELVETDLNYIEDYNKLKKDYESVSNK